MSGCVYANCVAFHGSSDVREDLDLEGVNGAKDWIDCISQTIPRDFRKKDAHETAFRTVSRGSDESLCSVEHCRVQVLHDVWSCILDDRLAQLPSMTFCLVDRLLYNVLNVELVQC